MDILRDPDVQGGLIRVHEQELTWLLVASDLQLFSEAFAHVEKENIRAAISRDKPSEAGRVLMRHLIEEPGLPVIYKTFLEITKKRDADVHGRLLCVELSELDVVRYAELLRKAKKLLKYLNPSALVDSSLLPKSLCAQVQSVSLQKNAEAAVGVLLREVPYCGDPEWYWMFMRALESNPDNLACRRFINPLFETQFHDHEAEKRIPPSKTQVVNLVDCLDDFQMEKNGIGAEEEATVESSAFELGENFGGSVEELRLRSYQEELCEAVLVGRNAIVVAPTGSGKTFIAVRLIQKHLLDARAANTPSKVVFLVPTTPLVEQQSGVLRRFLQDQFHVGAVVGGDCEAPKGLVVRSKHVTVMTPQCLVNILSNPSKIDRLEITDFSLLVFDECHHCDAKHPYMEVMMRYLELKLSPSEELLRGRRLPQIVGMTASLGFGSGQDVDTGKAHIVKMAANLDASVLATVQRSTADLAKFVNVPTDELEVVPNHHLNTPFSIYVNDTMKIIEGRIRPLLEDLATRKSPVMAGLKAEAPEVSRRQRFKPIYQGWVGTLLSRAPEVHDSDMKRTLVTCLEHLKDYQLGLELFAHLPADQATAALKDKFEDRAVSQSAAIEVFLMQQWQTLKEQLALAEAEPNPLVEKLREVLAKEYQRRPDSRSIVFVRTRALTRELQFCIQRTEYLRHLQPEVLTSANTSSEKYGQSETEQKEALAKFREGISKVLVATTVAEEGLDIEKCNLIIKYNHVTNEIALVQKRGRGRAEGSRSVLLAQGGLIADQEMANMIKEKAMHQAIQATIHAGFKAFRIQVERMQKLLQKDRDAKKLMAQTEQKMLGNKKFLLKCRKCDQLLCHSDAVRKVQDAHYVCVDPEIWKRTEPRRHTKPQVLYMLAIPGKLHCGGCQQDLGNIMKYKNVFLPSLSGSALTVTEVENPANKKVGRQWKVITEKFFVVGPIVERDLLLMHRSTMGRAEAALLEHVVVEEQKKRNVKEKELHTRAHNTGKPVEASMEEEEEEE